MSTSQSRYRSTAPLPRGASGEEGKLYGMPRPLLDRSNNDDRRQWRKQGVAVGAAASKTQAKRCGCWVPQPGQWHAVGVTERLTPFSNLTNEKAPVSQRTKSPERREPVISVTGHPWYHSLCCAISTAALHDRLFGANRCPYNGGLPSGPTVCFSPAAQGPVTETLCTALHHPAALCTQKKIVFSPSTHLRFVQSGFILAKPAAPVKQFCSQ